MGINDFLKVLDDSAEDARQPEVATLNLMDALGKSPEEAANNYRLEKKTNIPASLMADPDVRKQAEEDAFVKSLNLRKALGTTQFLANPQNAAMSTDLVDGMTSYEDQVARASNKIALGVLAPFVEDPKDLFVTGARGLLGVAQFPVGLANLPTGGAVGEWLQDQGLSPREARKALFESYSLAQKRSYEEFEKSEGFTGAAKAIAVNPSLWFNAILESLPLIVAGGAVGKGALKIAPAALGKLGGLLGVAPETAAAVAAGAFGEGAVATGMMAEELRGDDDLSFKEAAASIMAGVGTGLTAGLMGRVSDALDVVDVQRLVMGEATAEVAEASVAGLLKRFMGAAITEGAEEGIQEAQEQMWSNWAEDRPLLEGVPQNVTLGIITGAAMGAGGQAQATVADFGTKANEVMKERLISAMESKELAALRERSPDAYREFVQGVSEHHNIDQLYFQADKIVEAAEAQGIDPEAWADQYGISPEDMNTALQAGGVVAIETGDVALGMAEDKVIQSLRKEILADPTGTTLANLAKETEADRGTFVHLNTLFQEAVDAKIDSSDIDLWVDEIMATPKIRGKVTRESFVPLAARANALAELTGVKAITHLNRMLKASNLRVMKQKDFEKEVGSEVLQQSTPTQSVDKLLQMVQKDLTSRAKEIQAAEGDSRAELVAEFKEVLDENLMGDEVQEVAAEVFKETGYDHDFINLAQAMRKAEPRSFSSGALTDIAKLRQEMGVSTKVFNKLMADAAAEGKIFLHRHVHPGSLSKAEKANYLKLPGSNDIYMGVVPQDSWRKSAPLLQKGKKGKKKKAYGALSTLDNGEHLVTLFTSANKSTFLHETGHIFLNDLKYVAEEMGVQKEQWEATKKWLGIKGDKITTRQHERFARSFEAYLREGRAPSIELKDTFQTYMDWLTNIYKSFWQLSAAAGFNVEINPTIRDIFDNVLATKEEIAAAREEAGQVPLITDTLQNETGFTKAQIRKYREKLQAIDRAVKQKRNTHKFKGRSKRLKAWRDQAKREAAEMPVYAFADKMKEVGGIDRNSVVQAIGKEATPRNHPSFKKNGMDVNVAVATYGEKFGYDTAQRYFEDVAKSPRLKEWIQKRVARLEAAYNNQQSIPEVIRVKEALEVLEMESEYLAERARAAVGPDAKAVAKDIVKPQPQKVIRAWARDVLSKMKASDINTVTHFRKLTSQSRKARKLAISEVQKAKAASKTQGVGEASIAWVNALRANEQARLNEALIAESYKIANRYKKMRAKWTSISKWANQKHSKLKIAEDYRNQINRVMAAHSVADKPFDPETPDLNTFAEEITHAELGETAPIFSEWMGTSVPMQKMVKGKPTIVNQASHKNLTWEQAQELNDAFEYLYGKGKEALEGMKTSDGLALSTWSDAIVDNLKDSTSKEPYASDASWLGRQWQRVQRQYRSYFAQMALLPFIAQRLDKYAEDGPAQQLVKRIRDAMANRNELNIEIDQKLNPIWKVLAKRTFSDGSTIQNSIPRTEGMIEQGYNWDTERVIAAAASLGNETSYLRLTEGNELSQASIEQIGRSLTKEQWQAIQGLWNLNDFLWPKISATHQRLNYFTPKRVKARPFTVTTADGYTLELKGGYYPIFYDKKLVPKAAKFQEAEEIIAAADNRFQRPTPKSGMTRTRAASVQWAMDLTFAPLATHFKDVTTYITMSEAVRDADRVFRDKDVARRGREVYGQEIMDMIRPALKDSVRPDLSWQNSWVEWGRRKTSVFYMGWNFWTAFQNTTGVFPVVRHIGGWANYFDGAKFVNERGYRDSYNAMLELSPYMKLREDNIQREMSQKLKTFEFESSYSMNIDGKNYSFEDFQALGFAGIRFVDNIVSTPGWWSKYNAEMEAHGNPKKAVSAADEAINKALGSGLAIDTTQAMRSPITGLITNFMSFAATQQENMQTDWEAYKIGEIDTQEFAYRQLMTWIAPAMMSTFLKGMVMYGFLGALGLRPDDKEQNQDTMDYALDVASYRVMGMHGFRELANAFIYRYGTPGRKASIRLPTMQFWDMIAATLGHGGELAYKQDQRSTERLLWSLAELGSFAVGVPATQVYRRIRRGLDQIKKGKTGLGGVGNLFIPQPKKRKG